MKAKKKYEGGGILDKKKKEKKTKKPDYRKTETFQDYKSAAATFSDYNPKSDTVFVGTSLDPGMANKKAQRQANISTSKGASKNNYNEIPKMFRTKNEAGQDVYVSVRKYDKNEYSKGGMLPPAIKKLKEKAFKKKAEKAKPSYRGKLDEVTVTAKAPTESEKAGAKAFIDKNSGTTDKVMAYASAAKKVGDEGFYDNLKKGKELSKDTSKRLKLKMKFWQKAKLNYGKSKDGRQLNEKLKKAGYKK
jgi:hypothetical protein